LGVGGDISGDINLSGSSPNVNVKITNATTGEVVKNIELGPHSQGKVHFVWDGLKKNKLPADVGVYKIEATAYIDGKNTVMETDIKSKVDSVSMGSGANGLKVNLTGLDSVNFNQIKQIL